MASYVFVIFELLKKVLRLCLHGTCYVSEFIFFMWQVLGDQSPIVKHLERDHAGNISAMSLEMDQTEVFHYTESLDALRKKIAEATDTLL